MREYSRGDNAEYKKKKKKAAAIIAAAAATADSLARSYSYLEITGIAGG
jgi:hypothetical protein